MRFQGPRVMGSGAHRVIGSHSNRARIKRSGSHTCTVIPGISPATISITVRLAAKLHTTINVSKAGMKAAEGHALVVNSAMLRYGFSVVHHRQWFTFNCCIWNNMNQFWNTTIRNNVNQELPIRLELYLKIDCFNSAHNYGPTIHQREWKIHDQKYAGFPNSRQQVSAERRYVWPQILRSTPQHCGYFFRSP